MSFILGVDFDMVVHRAAFGAQKSEKSVVVHVDPVHFALHNCKSIIETMRAKLKPDGIIGYLGARQDPTNYRLYYGKEYGCGHTRPKGYKEHRKKDPKPVHYLACRDYLMATYKCDLAIGEEADDRLGIDMTKGRIHCIASLDKDLDMILGRHYNWVKGIEYIIYPEQGIVNFYKQFLVGDTADNIPGVDGIGPVKAAKLIDHLDTEIDMFNVVRDIYNDDKRLLDIGRCLWIRRKEGQMWTFPG